MKFQVTNWAEYEAGLRRRGSLTLWVTDEAIDGWSAEQRTTPGGQATYSDSAIQICLMLRTAFKLALRQGEGLMRRWCMDTFAHSKTKALCGTTADAGRTRCPFGG